MPKAAAVWGEAPPDPPEDGERAEEALPPLVCKRRRRACDYLER
jgi:hypothetical protein